jgi:hypothetical protein
MSRLTDNLTILKRLATYIRRNPDQRFGQILRNTGVITTYIPEGEYAPQWSNHFNEEPSTMLERMRKVKKGIK